MSRIKVTNLRQDSATSDNISLDSSGNVAFQAGTVSAPAIQATGDSNTGIYFPAADTIAFTEGGNEAVRIDSSSRLLVGTSSAYNGSVGGRLQSVSTASGNYPPIGAISNYSGDVGNPAQIFYKYDNNSTTSQVFARFIINNTSSGSGQINANGASQAAFGSYSDARLKENIVNLPSQWQNFKALRPVEFDYIQSHGGGHQLGFIAQEVEEIFEDLVGQGQDEMLTLSGLGKNEARLIKALQEAMERIEQLETEMAEVKTQLQAS